MIKMRHLINYPDLRIQSLVVLLLGLGFFGCQSSAAVPTQLPTPPESPTTPIPTPTLAVVSAHYRTIQVGGQFVFSPGDGSIWVQDASTYKATPLLKRGDNLYYEAPSFSPDGKRIVYAAYTFSKTGAQIKEIREMNTDGTAPRTLFKTGGSGPDVSFGDPRYTPDGTSLYFTATTLAGGASRERKTQVGRGTAADGNWQVVVSEGQGPTVSEDGKRIAYLKFNAQRFTSSLWVANEDGGGAKQILADNIFAGILGQRFSPDGKYIVFAASGTPSRDLPAMTSAPTAFVSNECALGWATFCLLQSAHADGLPWDLWLAKVDGTSFKQLTNLGLDSPFPAFSKDGRYVAFVSVNGLFVYDRETSQISLLDRERIHGVLDWHQE